MDVLQGGGETAVQVVKSTESKTKSDVAEAETGAGALHVSDASSAVTPDSESGVCVKTCFATRVSMFEEPCAENRAQGSAQGVPGNRRSYCEICLPDSCMNRSLLSWEMARIKG